MARRDADDNTQLLMHLLGEERALAMMREVGGTQIKIVRGLTRSSAASRARLAEIIGEDGYEILLRHFGASAVFAVPMGAKLLREHDIARACTLLDDGLSVNEIALRLRRSYRWVERVTKRVPDTQLVTQAQQLLQPGLFDNLG